MIVLGHEHDASCLVARYPDPPTWENPGFPWCTCTSRNRRRWNPAELTHPDATQPKRSTE